MEYIKEKRKNRIRLSGRWVKGSAVVEMSYIIPLFLGLFVLIVYAVFYYHDKAVLNGAAGETAILGVQAHRRAEADYDLESFFYERTQGKLIYMTDVTVSVGKSGDLVEVSASAEKEFMKLSICQSAKISTPEENLRRTEVIL